MTRTGAASLRIPGNVRHLLDRRRTAAGAACFLLLTLLAGCGYHRPGHGDAGRPAPSVHLAALGNDTVRPGLHGTVAGAIRRQLLLDLRMRVADAASADFLLTGRVNGYGVEALAFDQADIGRRFRVLVVATLTATSRADNRVRFQGSFRGEAYYTAADTAQAVRTAEEEAVRRAAQDLAGQVAARLLEEW